MKIHIQLKNGTLWLSCLCYLLLPAAASWLLFGQAFPFYLKGPQFLVFYLAHMCTAYGILLALKRRPGTTGTLRAWLIALTWIIALLRITQGALRHKPVGFLVLLLLLHTLLLAIPGRNARMQKTAGKKITRYP